MGILLGVDRSVDDQFTLGLDLLLIVSEHPASTHEMKRQATEALGALSTSAPTGERLELDDALFAARRQLASWATATPGADVTIPEPDNPSTPIRLDPLTARELEVLQLVEQGFSNRDIAARLVLTVGTVKWYIHQVNTKLGAHNRGEAVYIARRFGLLP